MVGFEPTTERLRIESDQFLKPSNRRDRSLSQSL